MLRATSKHWTFFVGTCTGFIVAIPGFHVHKDDLQGSCIKPAKMKKPWELFSSQSSKENELKLQSKKPIRIGIIGGGLCGVTAARSLVQKLPSGTHDCQITIIEGDINTKYLINGNDDEGSVNDHSKIWKAAAARNANSLGKNIMLLRAGQNFGESNLLVMFSSWCSDAYHEPTSSNE